MLVFLNCDFSIPTTVLNPNLNLVKVRYFYKMVLEKGKFDLKPV